MIGCVYYHINVDMDNILFLLADIKNNIACKFHQYSISENLMISNIGAMILTIQRKQRPYQVNICMNTTSLWMMKSIVL